MKKLEKWKCNYCGSKECYYEEKPEGKSFENVEQVELKEYHKKDCRLVISYLTPFH